MKRYQSGFTLIEIAIVLVIIGLLLGGVLKGQELINSAKVKNLIGDFKGTASMVYAYQDRFRRLPGDDGDAAGHVGGANATTPVAADVGNGRINGNWNSATQTDESYLFWQHVRLAQLTAGSTVVGAADYNYVNADGGRVGITGDAVIPGWAATFFVCSAGIQGRYARQIDTTIDDGNTTTGNVRVIGAGEVANAAASPANLTPANDATLYTVCVSN